MENKILNYLIWKFNELTWKYGLLANIKSRIRDVKYFFVGKTGIDFVIDEIKKQKKSNPVKVIFDVGAAVGDKTIAFLRAYPEAIVYCFEPQSEASDILKKRTFAYGKRVKIFNFGFLNRNDEVVLNVYSYRDSSSIIPLQEPIKSHGKITMLDKRKIKVCKLDDFIKGQNINHIDLIKIDVEGVEKEVLEGGQEALENKIENVFIETSLENFPEISKLFLKNKFNYVGKYVDYFFSKDKKYGDKSI